MDDKNLNHKQLIYKRLLFGRRTEIKELVKVTSQVRVHIESKKGGKYITLGPYLTV